MHWTKKLTIMTINRKTKQHPGMRKKCSSSSSSIISYAPLWDKQRWVSLWVFSCASVFYSWSFPRAWFWLLILWQDPLMSLLLHLSNFELFKADATVNQGMVFQQAPPPWSLFPRPDCNITLAYLTGSSLRDKTWSWPPMTIS